MTLSHLSECNVGALWKIKLQAFLHLKMVSIPFRYLTAIDLGASWIHDSHPTNPITQLAQRFGVVVCPTSYNSVKVWSERKRTPYSKLKLLYQAFKQGRVSVTSRKIFHC